MSVTISLEGKVAVVTGASRGIGEAIARAFAENGAKVVVASRKIEGVRAVAEQIGEAAHAVAAHTGREEECKALVAAAVARFGKVDILVNNAATNPYFGPFLAIDNGAWDKTFEVNLKGYFWMAREVAKHLIDRGAPGSIVSIASVAGLEASPLQGVYGMTKAAIISMTKTLSYELATSKIRVNAIAPGLVRHAFCERHRRQPGPLRRGAEEDSARPLRHTRRNRRRRALPCERRRELLDRPYARHRRGHDRKLTLAW